MKQNDINIFVVIFHFLKSRLIKYKRDIHHKCKTLLLDMSETVFKLEWNAATGNENFAINHHQMRNFRGETTRHDHFTISASFQGEILLSLPIITQ